MKIKYILTHPIHYQVPLIKFLKKKKMKIQVNYRCDLMSKKYYDPGFKKKINIGINLLNGYEYKFLNYIGPNKVSSLYPITTDFFVNIFEKDTEIIWLHGIKNWYNLCLMLIAKILKKKVFIRDEVFHESKERNILNRIFNKFFYIFIDKFIDVYLAIGSQNKKYYLDQGINKRKITNVPYVVNNNFFFNKNLRVKKKINYLFVAKLQKKKGADLLLQAIKFLNYKKNFINSTNFHIVGDGEMEKNLKRFKKKEKIKNIKFSSFKNQNELKKIYKFSDVFIIPSTIEPWGLTVNEAMAAGTAIISSNKVGSSFDLVKNNVNGYRFKSGDPKDLSKKIYYIFKNRKKIKQFKKNSLKIISEWDFEKCYFGLKKSIRILKIKKN